MKSFPFSEVVKDVTSKFKKIKSSEYLNEGLYEIIDQGKSDVAGYTNDLSLVNGQILPVIIFGDHTRAFKYCDSPIALGADGAKALLVNTDVAHSKYIYYYLRSINIKSAGYSRHFKFLKVNKIPLPDDINDQKRIAHLLGKVESLINQRKQNIQQLDDFVKSIFFNMFGEVLQDEAKYTSIKNICDFIDYRGKTPTRIEQGIPFISAKCVRSGYFDETRLDFISEETYQQRMTRGFPKANDLLFTTEGATFGFTCRVPRHYKKFAVGQRLISMVCKNGNQPEALEFLLNNAYIQKKLANRRSGSSVLGIRASELIKVELPVLPLDLQDKFSRIVEKVEDVKSHYQNSLGDLENLYGVLIQKAFNGELNLSKVPLPDESEEIHDDMSSVDQGNMTENNKENSILGFSQFDAASIKDNELRKMQLSKWFTEWLEHYQQESDLSIQHFWQCIEFTTQDYVDENDEPLKIDVSDYDHIKDEVFAAIKCGVIKQTTDMIETVVDGKTELAPGNKIQLIKQH